MNVPDKIALEEKYEVTLNNMFTTLHKIINMSKNQKEYIDDTYSMDLYEKLCSSAKELKEEVDATMGAIYELLPLYNGEKVVEKKVMELEEKYFDFIKKLCMQIPEWKII